MMSNKSILFETLINNIVRKVFFKETYDYKESDQYFTRIEDISFELEKYKFAFQGKVVYCNCDNPNISKFWEYFYNNFYNLGLKHLIASYYSEGAPTRWDYDGRFESTTPIKSGRFQDNKSILQECNIVVTNPPFSVFTTYMRQLISSNKQFIIIGPILSARSCLDLFKKGEVFVDTFRKKAIYYNPVTKKYKAFGNHVWFTNIPTKQNVNDTHDTVCEFEKNKQHYSRDEKTGNLLVPKSEYIPTDYTGIMEVPITYLMGRKRRFNPNGYEILDIKPKNSHSLVIRKKNKSLGNLNSY